MPLFSRKRTSEVQGFMLKLINNNCTELKALIEGPRLEGRVRLTIVVLVIPMVKGKPFFTQMFAAVTKEFSSTGVSLVVNHGRALEEVILAFRWERSMRYVRAKAKHLSPMGAGFYQLGMQMTGMAEPGDYPGLADVTF